MLPIREMQIKTTMRYRLTLVRVCVCVCVYFYSEGFQEEKNGLELLLRALEEECD